MKSKKKTIIIVTIFIAIIAALVLFIMYGGKNTNEAPQATVESVDATQSSAEIIASQDSFSKFDAALTQNGLVAQLDGETTVFVPNNQAFDELPQTDKITETLDKSITGYHIVKGVFLVADLNDGQKLPTVAGQDLVVKVEDGQTYILDAKGNKITILTADLKSSNGVIHETGQVFLPQ